VGVEDGGLAAAALASGEGGQLEGDAGLAVLLALALFSYLRGGWGGVERGGWVVESGEVEE
jgi:hypothetical protein